MKNDEYKRLHKLPKKLNRNKIYCAALGTQEKFYGHGTFNSNEKFTVIQVRKGKRRKNSLTYVLLYKSEIMVRVDVNGAAHHGVHTPHIHIFDDEHNQGEIAISLSEIKNYDETDEIIKSFIEFLKYNKFDLNITIQEKIV